MNQNNNVISLLGYRRRTQLSSFVPRVLLNATASTSAAASNSQTNANGSQTNASSSQTNGEQKRPMSNTDFRNMLLNK